MLISNELTTDIEINTLSDLSKLKNLTDNTNLKVNDSELSRKLGKDRRTIKKYRNGYVKKPQETGQVLLTNIMTL